MPKNYKPIFCYTDAKKEEVKQQMLRKNKSVRFNNLIETQQQRERRNIEREITHRDREKTYNRDRDRDRDINIRYRDGETEYNRD